MKFHPLRSSAILALTLFICFTFFPFLSYAVLPGFSVGDPFTTPAHTNCRIKTAPVVVYEYVYTQAEAENLDIYDYRPDGSCTYIGVWTHYTDEGGGVWKKYKDSYTGEYIDDCAEKEIAWAALCSPLLLGSFDCNTNTFFCQDSCEERQLIAAASCVSGELEWYDCEIDTFACVIKTCADYEAECLALYDFPNFTCYTDGQGSVTNTICENDDCLQEADDWAVANCHDAKYLDQYNCATNTGLCIDYTCSDLFADCVDKCGGDVDYFSCLTQDGDTQVTAPCVCEDFVEVASDNPISNTPSSGEQTPEVDDTDNTLLAKVTNNTALLNQNAANIANVLEQGFDGLGKKMDEDRALQGSINDNLASLTDDITNADPGALPSENSYETDLTNDLPQEEDLEGTLTGWISSTPFLQNLQSSHVLLNNPDACLSGFIAGQNVQYCFSDHETVWDTMGNMLLGLSSLFAFFIVARR